VCGQKPNRIADGSGESEGADDRFQGDEEIRQYRHEQSP